MLRSCAMERAEKDVTWEEGFEVHRGEGMGRGVENLDIETCQPCKEIIWWFSCNLTW